MKRYLKGNTPGRNRRIANIHKKFKARQSSWVLRRLVKAAQLRKKYR